jgi:hypothetical protein
LKNIRFAFEKDKGIIPWLIRRLTKCKYNHVAVIYDSVDWEDQWVVEAAFRGVRAIPDKNRKWECIATPMYDLSEELRSESKYIGEKYELKALFIFAWIILAWRWLKLKVRKPYLKGNRQICSELVAHVVKHIHPEEFKRPQWTSPADLLHFFKNSPHYKVEEFNE